MVTLYNLSPLLHFTSFYQLAHTRTMKLVLSPSLIYTLISLFFLPTLISSQTCQRNCGKIPLKFPFGSSPGCGDPRFQQYVTCNQQKVLIFTTHTGSYPITDIDYTNQVMYISDPSISTCSCTQASKGFGLDWEAPFSFHDDTVFALLDCSNASPVYRPSNGQLNTDTNSSKVPLCDKDVSICSFLYSCRAISTINLPISTCCVYTPVDLGPAFDMDLEKLQCSSYSGFYSFNGKESDPSSWKYGMSLKYKFSVNNEYPSSCANCERSYGVCGYSGAYNSFICNCPNGINTTNDCFFGASYNAGSNLLPWQMASINYTGAWLIYCLVFSFTWVL